MIPLGFIYKTTNLVNGKIYVGKHEFSKDKRLNSSYLGSGVALKRAIIKYGKENFNREKHLGKHHSEESKRKMSEQRKGVSHWWSTRKKKN